MATPIDPCRSLRGDYSACLSSFPVPTFLTVSQYFLSFLSLVSAWEGRCCVRYPCSFVVAHACCRQLPSTTGILLPFPISPFPVSRMLGGRPRRLGCLSDATQDNTTIKPSTGIQSAKRCSWPAYAFCENERQAGAVELRLSHLRLGGC